MSRRVSLPDIDPRRASDLLQQLRRIAPHYTTEWRAKDDDDPGVALLKIFSEIAEGVVNRLNRAPDRNFLAFLDMLGIRLLPKTAARAPVTFRVVDGTEKPFIILKRTQVAAGATDTRPTELPYETIENLLAIPAKLVAMYAVDPKTDRIHRPPSGFLELQKVEILPPQLKVTAFSAVRSKFLQLEPPDQVKKGDFLRIEHKLNQNQPGQNCIPGTNQSQQPVIDHLVVSEVKGSIVTVTDPLPRDYLEGTLVQKEAQFELFEAKNWQEHILYLAHKDYFAIKSEAKIEFLVEHAAGASANLQPFKIVWEFFGVIDSDPLKEEGWHKFAVDLDGTVGFSQDGRVILNKPAGEIKETEINANKSRWIRARLDEALPATPARPQPTLESIQLAVSSGGKNLPPDQAFHNDTPLTTDVEFFPFGTEPRIFDRFSIASEEAFSKHGAEIELQFTMDTSDLLAAPAGIVVKDPSGIGVNDTLRVFGRSAGGKVLGFKIATNPPSSVPKKIPTPPETRIIAQTTPAVRRLDSNDIGVFVKAEDGKMWLHLIPSDETQADWYPLQSPPGKLMFDPAAISVGDHWQVFVVADNQLFSKDVSPRSPTSGVWKKHDGNFQVASTPYAVISGSRFAVGVTDNKRNTWIFDNVPNQWKNFTPKQNSSPLDEFLGAENARPYLRFYTSSITHQEFIRIFLRSKRDELVVFDTEKNANAKRLGKPNGTVNVDSNPFVVDRGTSEVAFVRGSDNRLWERENDASASWIPHLNPADFSLAGDPFAFTYKIDDRDLISVFSTTDKNSLLEFQLRGADKDSGKKLQAGPLEIVILEDNLETEDHFIHIKDGPVRSIDHVLSFGKFAVLDEPLDEPVPVDTEYDLFEKKASGVIKTVISTETETVIELESSANPEKNQFLFVAGDVGEIRRIVDATGHKATFDLWPKPKKNDKYHLLSRVKKDRKVSESAANRALLDDTASSVRAEVEGFFLEITSGPGKNPIGKLITNYDGTTKAVTLSQPFTAPHPKKDSEYKIAVTSLAESLAVYPDTDQTDLRPELSWEYWNGRGFVALRLKKETTENFLVTGKVTFTVPEDIAKTDVGGQENYWIRARIVGGDYGREIFIFDDSKPEKEIKIKKDPIRPPLIKKLVMSYTLTEMKDPQYCLTFNNLNYLDQTAANTTADKHFKPYVPLADTSKTVYFGFDQAFEGAPVRIYFAAKELEVDESKKPKLTWQFAFKNDWKTLLAQDDTNAFTKPEFVSLSVGLGFQNTQQFGRALYWLRATLAEGEWKGSPLFDGVFINTVEALQARTVRDEILGSSTALKNQLFRFQQTPVIPREENISGEEIIPGEEIRVREALTDREREDLTAELGKDAVLTIKDQQGRVIETWIKWTEVQEFFDSKPESRHYRLDRHTGELEFGNGINGRIPPPGGDNIRAFAYQGGGGAAGNVAPGEINSPVTAVAGVDTVINPVAAGGGSEAATNEDMMEIGPEQISNRGRAVTPDDFEQLAREASREVRKSLCLPNRNESGRYETGWTSVHIVPDSKDAEPMPSLELRRAVQRFLAQRADLTLVDQEHLFVGPPEYVPISVEANVFARSLDVVSIAEQNAIKKLDQFLHPLTGGFDGEGWDFGRDLAVSDLYRILEDIEEVDHVEQLLLRYGDRQSEERVEVSANALLASGTHKINMNVATGE